MSKNILGLLLQHGLNPVKVSDNHDGEYASPCPKCGGTDCFRAWPDLWDGSAEGDSWFCRRCGRGGTREQFLEEFGDHPESEPEKRSAITPEERAQLRMIHASATLGPWAWEPDGDSGNYHVGVVMGEDDKPIIGYIDDPTLVVTDVVANEVVGDNNAIFLVVAYNNFPLMLNALDALEQDLARVKAAGIDAMRQAYHVANEALLLRFDLDWLCQCEDLCHWYDYFKCHPLMWKSVKYTQSAHIEAYGTRHAAFEAARKKLEDAPIGA